LSDERKEKQQLKQQKRNKNQSESSTLQNSASWAADFLLIQKGKEEGRQSLTASSYKNILLISSNLLPTDDMELSKV
jgi:hypothetical protein